MSYELSNRIYQTWQQAKSNIINGVSPAYFDLNSHPIVGTGASVLFNQDYSVSVTPDTRNHISMSPEATILIKKKAFSTLRGSSEIKLMDKTEKMLLRATKALFAYKVQQIRAYESLTKFDNFFQKNNSYSMSLLSSFINESAAVINSNEQLKTDLQKEAGDLLNDLTNIFSASSSVENTAAVNDDILAILKRNAFSEDSGLTTWIVDPESPENYTLGPGTGVIELTTFTGFRTSISKDSSPSSANIDIAYPYRIGTVLEEDIEIAIEEALKGSLGLFSELMNGGISSESLAGQTAYVDGASILSAAFELSNESFFDTAIDTNYVRDRLRTFYLGKPFINASDIVHFYIRGNRTFTDFSSADSTYSEETSESPFDEEYMEIDEVILKAEHQLYTGGAISYPKYKELRKLQDNSFGMIHVFAGLVTDTMESYGGGFWKLGVNVSDNMSWLNWSRYQSEPSLSNPKNVLEDPLTPFEFEKDEQGKIISSSRDLLYENKALLQSGLLNYDSGLLAGQNASEGNLIQGQYNGLGSLDGKKVMQHPSGFVYRWKTGIVTATAGFASANETDSGNPASQWGQLYQPTVTNGVLNNLDIPNVLSVLIVGQPYNIETFIEQAYTAHNIKDKSGGLDQRDPITGVLDSIRKQNVYYGNFHPYRMLTMSSASTQQMLNNVGNREILNNNVKSLQKRKQQIKKRINDLNDTNNTSTPIIKSLEDEIQTIDRAIADQINKAVGLDNALTSQDRVGIEISLGGSVNLPIADTEEENNDITRAMMLTGAQRRIEDVRLNRDRNLFIVSDQYDTADIRPFILGLNKSGWRLFEGKYSTVYQMCSEVTKYLNLEFFANSQGHLEFRPPLWNRVPLTILKETIKKQNSENTEIIPSFITNLFSTRIETLYLNIHNENIKIALACLMLGRYPDSTLLPNVKAFGTDSLAFFGISHKKDKGESDNEPVESGGRGGDIVSLGLRQTNFEFKTNRDLTEERDNFLSLGASFQDKGDVLFGNTETLLGTFDIITQERGSLLNDLENVISSNTNRKRKRKESAAKYTAADLNAIRNSFRKQFGRDPANGLLPSSKKEFTNDDLIYLVSEKKKVDAALNNAVDVTKTLEKAISNRDSYVSMLQANLLKQRELEEINEFLLTGENADFEGTYNGSSAALNKTFDFLEKSANGLSAASDIITGKIAEGTVYDHLIEDDTRNLLGYGSGKRFILKDEYIKTASFSEKPPEFTRVDVLGNAPLIGEGLRSQFDGLYFWAGATDFDLWKQYGYKDTQIDLPFVSDPEGQGRPYAYLELAMQKLKVNSASVNIIGNEFYQPGDTVYIPSKGLLYYVTSVNHTFDYGSSFNTTLNLEYGHPVGNYIPSPLDVIGQQLVSNVIEDPAIVYRTDRTDDNYTPLRPDCSLVFPTGEAGPAELLAYSDNNVRFTNMMIDVTSRVAGSSYLLIRGFVKDSNEDITDTLEKMAIVRYLFENPSQLAQSNQLSLGDDLVNAFGSLTTTFSSAAGGGSVGTTKTLTQMRLPNNLPVVPISPSKIIEQVSYFKKEFGDDGKKNFEQGQIRCLNRDLALAMQIDAGQFESLSSGVVNGIFPRGGPSQASWGDLRDEVAGINKNSSFKSNVIEIGIIRIPSSLLSKTL
jgi:hypothetical protein